MDDEQQDKFNTMKMSLDELERQKACLVEQRRVAQREQVHDVKQSWLLLL